MIFVLVGRIEEPQLPDLQKLLESEPKTARMALDLREVRLVDREGVKFLAACETKGVQLKNCPLYVRNWIEIGSAANGSDGDRDA